MNLVETITVGAGGSANVEFVSIPQDSSDLLVLVSARLTATTFYPVYLSLNGDTTTLYNNYWLRGNGTSVDHGGNNPALGSFIGQYPGTAQLASAFANGSVFIPNYVSATRTKVLSTTYVGEDNQTLAYQQLGSSRYPVTNPITSLKITPLSGLLAEGTSISLYKTTQP